MRWRVNLHNVFLVILALNYFAFRTELFRDEYEHNHPDISKRCSFTSWSLTWETFDKDNAPQAFVFDAGLQIEVLLSISPQLRIILQDQLQYQPVRDKSPPTTSSYHA